MQVFVPYPDFAKSVQCLDSSRLNKQALEATQLLDIIFQIPTKSGKPRKGWYNHPALIAWKDTPGALIQYLEQNIIELKKRGFSTPYYSSKLEQYRAFDIDDSQPIWLGDDSIHSSHRARLLQKGYEAKLKGQSKADSIIEWYRKFDWSEMNDPELFQIEYFWPVKTTSGYVLEQRVSKDAKKGKIELISVFGTNPYMSL